MLGHWVPSVWRACRILQLIDCSHVLTPFNFIPCQVHFFQVACCMLMICLLKGSSKVVYLDNKMGAHSCGAAEWILSAHSNVKKCAMTYDLNWIQLISYAYRMKAMRRSTEMSLWSHPWKPAGVRKSFLLGRHHLWGCHRFPPEAMKSRNRNKWFGQAFVLLGTVHRVQQVHGWFMARSWQRAHDAPNAHATQSEMHSPSFADFSSILEVHVSKQKHLRVSVSNHLFPLKSASTKPTSLFLCIYLTWSLNPCRYSIFYEFDWFV